jgi:hypothetical protein
MAGSSPRERGARVFRSENVERNNSIGQVSPRRYLLLWLQFGLLASTAVPLSPALAADSERPTQTAATAEVSARRELVVAAFQWLDATLARDFAAQSRFYPERMPVFYLWRDVPKSAVLAEKRRVFEQASTIDIKMDAPQLLVDAGGRSGRMYFRKTYVIRGGKLNRTGEVLQELRWEKQSDGWKIVSERDLRVIRQARRQ